MAKKPFALRIDEQMLEALQRWADDEFRSVNGQIEYLLKQALLQSGRAKLQVSPTLVFQPPALDDSGDDSNADSDV